ncbi:erythromycin esterase family protein [Nocardia sp. NPDC005978]|uniref:erythromycin esterase family protein n=1 Tax=Nocardia sp. NPDC005978 TaxID=3156725 RepID=UPI0033A4AFBC
MELSENARRGGRQRTQLGQEISEVAVPLRTVEPDEPWEDLRPLVALTEDAAVLGYGAGTRGAHEVSALQDRIARLLVSESGFRIIALDQDWSLGLRLDTFVCTGVGDPREILTRAEAFAATEEVVAMIRWVRAFNRDHPGDPVRVVGVSPHAIEAGVYDTVLEYVRAVAPDRVSDLRELYADVRPEGDIDAHTGRFRRLPDRAARVDRVRAAHRLVSDLAADDEDWAWVVQSARMIVQYHELHDHDSRPEDPANMAYYEAAFAENVEWWHHYTERRVLFWSSSSHTANARYRGFPPDPAQVSRNAGSYLRERLGARYFSLGIGFSRGTVTAFDGGEPVQVRHIPPHLLESALDAVDLDIYLLDLSADHPATVAHLLSRTADFRVMGPGSDGTTFMTGGSPGEWFDVIVHCRRVTAARPLRA